MKRNTSIRHTHRLKIDDDAQGRYNTTFSRSFSHTTSMIGFPPLQQARELLKKNKNILIVIGNSTSIDGIASGLALSHMLQKMGKRSKVVTTNTIPEHARFLPGSNDIQKELHQHREYICKINTENNPITQLRYDKEEKHLCLYITPKNREIKSSDIQLVPGKYLYDLIIICNAADLEQLGTLYEEHTELFYELPIINIDHHASNEYFGAINIVDVKATSTTELLYFLFAEQNEKNLTEEIATCLLAGIIADTNSFQSPHTTPKALTTAAALIEKGANQQHIIKHLYKTKELPTLKLWGRILARMEMNNESKLAWSMVTKNDFEKTRTNQTQLGNVFTEIAEQFPNINTLLLLFEGDKKEIEGRIITSKHTDEEQIINAIKGIRGPRNIIQFTTTETDIATAERSITEKLRTLLQLKKGRNEKMNNHEDIKD